MHIYFINKYFLVNLIYLRRCARLHVFVLANYSWTTEKEGAPTASFSVI
jgi:hypothetical protein